MKKSTLPNARQMIGASAIQRSYGYIVYPLFQLFPKRVTLPMLIIPYPNAKAGQNLKIQERALPIELELQMSLRTKVKIGSSPPRVKVMKQQAACALPQSLQMKEAMQVKEMYDSPQKMKRSQVAPKAEPYVIDQISMPLAIPMPIAATMKQRMKSQMKLAIQQAEMLIPLTIC